MKKLKSIISDLILQRSGWYLFFLSVQLASMLIAEKFKTINKEVIAHLQAPLHVSLRCARRVILLYT